MARRVDLDAGLVLLLLVVGAAIIIYTVMHRKGASSPSASYKNAEEWEITWNSDGLPTKVVIHRDAVQVG